MRKAVADVWSRRDTAASWLLLTYVALFAALFLVAPFDLGLRPAALDLGQMVTPSVAGILCWLVSRRVRSGWEKWSWRVLSFSGGGWLLGQMLSTYHRSLEGPAGQAALMTNLAWLLSYCLLVAALLLHLPWGRGIFARLAFSLDVLLLATASAGLFWHIILDQVLDGVTVAWGDTSELATSAAGVFLILAVVSVAFRSRMDRGWRSFFLLVGAVIAQTVGGTMYIAVLVQGTYAADNPIDVFWPLSFALIGLSAIERFRRTDSYQVRDSGSRAMSRSSTRSLYFYLPYVAVLFAGILMYLESRDAPGAADVDASQMWTFAVGLVSLVLLRQFLMILDNTQLSHSLALLSRNLEALVAERTKELVREREDLTLRTTELAARTEQLTALNRVSTRLGHCTSSGEVLTTALELATEASRLPVGVIWVARSDGRLDLVAHRGLTESTKTLMASLSDRAPALARAVLDGRPMLLGQSDIQSLDVPSESGLDIPFSAVAAPLIARGHVLGAISLCNWDGVVCGQADLQLAQAIGAEVGVTLENVRRYEEVRRLADRDPVTGLLNHRAFYQRLEEELKRAFRTGQPISVVMMDLDGFKLFNDTYGHPVGDQVLVEVSSVLSGALRDSDVLARYGGDEFVAVLPETDSAGAVTVSERIRLAVAQHPYVPGEGSAVPIKLSFGIATYPHDARSIHELVGAADVNLYVSKQRGGDIVSHGEAVSEEDSAELGTFGALDGLVTAVDRKDHYTRRHSEDVTTYSLALAEALGLSEESQRTLRISALLHDVGKITVPDRILRKPGRLSDDEYEVIKQHALLGEMIIKGVPNVAEVIAAVGSHHERVDGAGYPRGLKAREIPLLGRILAVADAYSAMTTDRPYRKAMGPLEARGELLRAAGSQLDPELVELFIDRVVVRSQRDLSGASGDLEATGLANVPRVEQIEQAG